MARVLTILSAGLGNIIEATPMIAAIESMGHDIVVALNSNWPDVEKLLPWPAGDLAKGIDTSGCAMVALSFWASRYSLPETTPAGEKIKVYRTRLSATEFSEVECNMDVVRQLGYCGETPPPKLKEPDVPNPVEYSRYAVVAPGFQKATTHADWRNKAYPRWNEVLELLDIPTVVVGTEDENEDWCERAELNLCGKTDILQLAKVLHDASVVIACDNGPAHLADAYQVPTVVLFGPTSTLKNAYYQAKIVFMPVYDVPCRPCQFDIEKMTSCRDNICMKSIDPKQVVDVAYQIMR